MTETKNQVGIAPWPPLETASWWFDRASWVLAVSLVIGAISTGVIVWLGTVKEHHWDLLRESAATIVAKTNERAAGLELRAQELKSDNLFLEKLVVPRRWLDPSVRGATSGSALIEFARIWGAVSNFAGTKALVQVVPEFEAQRLARDVHGGLRRLGWLPEAADSVRTNIPEVWITEGVEIWTASRSDDPKAWDAAEALSASFANQGIGASSSTAKVHRDDIADIESPVLGDIRRRIPQHTVVVVIGPRPAFMPFLEHEAARDPKK